MKKFLSANEAVAYGAAQAGCVVASAYPGTPSTEILENVAKFKENINYICAIIMGLPCWFSLLGLHLPMQGVRVPSLVGELRSHMP